MSVNGGGLLWILLWRKNSSYIYKYSVEVRGLRGLGVGCSISQCYHRVVPGLEKYFSSWETNIKLRVNRWNRLSKFRVKTGTTTLRAPRGSAPLSEMNAEKLWDFS